jgi:hypothetical protein
MIFSLNLVIETGKNKENLRTDSDTVRNETETSFILHSLTCTWPTYVQDIEQEIPLQIASGWEIFKLKVIVQ